MPTKKLSAEILDVLPPAMRAIRSEMRGLAQPELTVAQLRILTRLDHAPHTNKQLAEWMGITPASMCRTVDVLVKRGLISRETAAEDRREVSLNLTQKGRTKFNSIQSATQKLLDRRISALSKQSQAELFLGLSHLREIFVLILILAGTAPLAQAAAEVGLKDAVRSALSKTETVGIGEARVHQAEQRITQARSRFFPVVIAGASFQQQDTSGVLSRQSSSLFGGRQSFSRVTLSQSLYEGGRDWAALNASHADREIQRQNLSFSGYGVFTQVAQSFYNVLSNQREVQNLKKTLDLARERSEEISRRMKIGRSRNTEWIAAQAQLSVLEAQRMAAEGTLVTATEQFVLLTGLPPDSTLVEKREQPDAPEKLEAYLSRLNVRPDIVAMQAQVDSAGSAVSVARSGHLPSLGISGNYYLSREGTQKGNVWDVGATLTFPLFAGGLVQAQVNEALERRHEIELQLSQTRRFAEIAIRTAYNNLRMTLDQLTALASALKSTETNYKEQEKNYRFGQATNLDVIQALNSFQDTKRTYDRTRYLALSAWAELKAATAQVSLAQAMAPSENGGEP